jgi:hypothetical protein
MGEDTPKDHLIAPIYNKRNKYPTASCFRLSKNRLCMIIRAKIMVRDAAKESD